MSVVSFLVVIFILWLIFFFIFLPLGIEIPEKHEFGHANSSPKKTYLFLKIEDYIEGLNETETLDDDNLKEILKKIILKEIRILFSIRPLVNIHINRVQ